ncbi:uncharacterized protein LOC127290447 isoform X2 [Leptopilina boulardi]|uniref:uncharacterized protein LOC127290447 isoform X2 n=1 Tax=Leptopilina boulardi TaxID=63433 RepID=UPI0021F58D94|nr:uncharacterized protein LOC127290447 isoform X2 [Leptopilina boulardi]XP_051174965.1 uncharacterized protein LOC127290447 isoform X2 [Leptopilina boulardi]
MDTFIVSNPLAAVQLILIFNYFNLLSDFLYTENYLAEVNQNKQIPVVNAFYDYFEENHNDETMQLKLIRYLLRGSDLYGEENNEQIDLIFINTMFDYIISSLVFDKYGNIYGFLADTIRKEKNLQFDYFLIIIKETLQNATFENEFGSNSKLTELSVNKIFNEIILPLFPKPMMTNLNLLSLDYIFEQAGWTYLRLGRLNNTYYNFRNSTFNNSHGNLFDEYILVGYIIESLLYHKQVDPLSLKSFALPALFYYILTEDKLKYESITNVIFNPDHWVKAYHNFFEYITNASIKIENQLKNDSIYQIHNAFSNFHSHAYWSKLGLSNINGLFKDLIHDFGEVYEKFDLAITQQLFNESLIGDLRGVEVNLIVTDDRLVNDSFNNSQHLFYDLVEFYYTNNKTSNYYALIRQNYTATFMKETDDPLYFEHITGPSLDKLKRFGKKKVLKFANENTDQPWEELMRYKKQQFKSYLTNYENNNLTENEWWKEFGLSLVPFYPCLSVKNNETKFCEKKIIKFYNKFSYDITSQLIEKKTQTLVSSLGTTIKKVFINNFINEHVIDIIVNKSKLSNFYTVKHAVYEILSLQIEKPEIEISCITQEGIKFLSNIIYYLENKINQSFTNVNITLNKINQLHNTYSMKIGNINGKLNYSLYVKTLDKVTGFGYKFLNIKLSINETIKAQLRTGYKLKDKIYISPYKNSSKNQKIYINLINEIYENENHQIFMSPIQNSTKYEEVFLVKLKNGTYIRDNEPNYFIYDINNQLRNKFINISFHGIINYIHDEKCNNDKYFKKTIDTKLCLRHWRYYNWTNKNEMRVRHFFKNKKNLGHNKTIMENKMRNMLKIYNFPDDLPLISVFENWFKNAIGEESSWSKIDVLDKSGLLNLLLYYVRFEYKDILIEEGKNRITSIYTFRERYKIEKGILIENMINNFNEQNAGYSMTFEDYYAIRNFATTGHERITGDTNEAKKMKLALYKLAIRQTRELYRKEEFDTTLFYFDSIPEDTFKNEVYIGKLFTLRKFTLTSTKNISATRFSARPLSGYRNILYEIKFENSYVRAKINVDVNDKQVFREKKVILLPGSEFKIEKIAICPDEKIGVYFLVELIFKSSTSKDYESILRQITQIG